VVEIKKKECENCGIEYEIKKEEESLDMFYCLNCRAQ
jgi:hypothetical protein